MALSTCPDCGKDISTQARSCPICGAPRRKHASITGRVLLILAVLVGVPGLILTVGLDSLASVNAVPPSNAYTVTYRVYGIMSGANVTYYNAQGGIQQEAVTVPWVKTMQVPRGAWLSLSAQHQDGWGFVMAQILVNGQEWKRSESHGSYSIATASGSCCPTTP